MRFLADREEQLHRLPDQEVFAKAIAEKRIILTFDLDFGEILALSGKTAVRVVLFRLQNTRTANVIRRLNDVLTVDTESLVKGVVIVVEDTRHRVRDLPINPSI
jgi:predicted nuclease of predicted toxin-antitoxin system